MIYVWLFILILFNACWLATVPFMLPGNWLMLATTYLFTWWQWDRGIFSMPLLIIVTVLALIGEIIEFFAGAGGAKQAGAGWLGALAAVGGAIVGAIVGTGIVPILGTILGACFGAGLATWIVERTTGKEQDARCGACTCRNRDPTRDTDWSAGNEGFGRRIQLVEEVRPALLPTRWHRREAMKRPNNRYRSYCMDDQHVCSYFLCWT